MKALTIAFSILAKVADLFAPRVPRAYHEPWQATHGLMELPPMEIQTTGGIRMPVTSDGKRWPGPAGSLMAVSRGEPYHRHRETGVLVPPMHRLYPTRLTPIPDVPEMPAWASQEECEKRISDALAKVDSARLSWLYDDPPELTPLELVPLDSQALASTDRTAVSRATDNPTSAMVELVRLASQDESDETAEVPAYMRKRVIQLQQRLRESE